MSREKHHQAGEEADQIVVIEIGGLIDQFDVGESDEKKHDGRAIKEPRRDGQR
jgi:hypothetical protein